ncbi:transposase [Nonomuraea phyllanthi]|uniref:transposase n=1 Tax=Nonomuraea phyllanthi TaxID=2219224 RepID=UPI001D153602|nr:transposase [Nonomuraea phyllanthi]
MVRRIPEPNPVAPVDQLPYATAIKQGTASTEATLRRFTESAAHPTYQAMLEVGRAQKTIFVARYLRLREIQEGLNVVESSNGANSAIFYGKGGDVAKRLPLGGDSVSGRSEGDQDRA